MKKQHMSDTWEQLIGLDADQAEAEMEANLAS